VLPGDAHEMGEIAAGQCTDLVGTLATRATRLRGNGMDLEVHGVERVRITGVAALRGSLRATAQAVDEQAADPRISELVGETRRLLRRLQAPGRHRLTSSELATVDPEDPDPVRLGFRVCAAMTWGGVEARRVFSSPSLPDLLPLVLTRLRRELHGQSARPRRLGPVSALHTSENAPAAQARQNVPRPLRCSARGAGPDSMSTDTTTASVSPRSRPATTRLAASWSSAWLTT
jgi:hypothetical protein